VRERIGPALAALGLALAMAPAPARAVDLVYERRTGDQLVRYLESRTAKPDGFAMSFRGSDGEESECSLAPDLSTRSWTMERLSDSTKMRFVREGRTIKAEGIFQGKPFRKTFQIDDDPWVEFHELGLDGFAAADRTAITFWTIDRRNLNLVKFRAEKAGEEEIEAGGVRQGAVKAKLSLTGVLSVLGWRAWFWLRAGDGRYLRLEAPGLTPADKPSLVSLVRESR
jgi:hypothetical protein